MPSRLAARRLATALFWLSLVWTVGSVVACFGAASRIGSGDATVHPIAIAGLFGGLPTALVALLARWWLGTSAPKD